MISTVPIEHLYCGRNEIDLFAMRFSILCKTVLKKKTPFKHSVFQLLETAGK